MKGFRFSLLATALVALFWLGIDAHAQSADRAALDKEVQSLREQLRQKEQQLLTPSAEERAAFAEFLSQPGTGLIRLLPREKYNDQSIMRGGGAYYSFTRLSNEYGQSSHLELGQNYLSAGFIGVNFGFLTKLGDVPLEAVSLDHPAVRYLAEFVTPSKEQEAREQHQRGYPGFNVNGFDYAHRVRAWADTTYVLRSVNYDDSDVLVAFRIVRQEADGSMLVLWKMLKKFPGPELARSNSAQ